MEETILDSTKRGVFLNSFDRFLEKLSPQPVKVLMQAVYSKHRVGSRSDIGVFPE